MKLNCFQLTQNPRRYGTNDMDEQKSQSLKEYRDHFASLAKKHSTDAVYSQAVGGEFSAVGQLELELLVSLGLRDGQSVVDVGCGSGRLAYQLSRNSKVAYIGCDVVPELLEYASSICNRNEWRFAYTDGSSIPADDASADFICFFSVFTHLTHEETFKYFLESRRVLKHGGLMVMSFLEFLVPSHWSQFRASVLNIRPDKHLNQFVSRDGIAAWANHSGLKLLKIYSGDDNYIPLRSEVHYDNGHKLTGFGTLGQSVAILKNVGSEPIADVIAEPLGTGNHSYIDSPPEGGEVSSKQCVVHGWIWFPMIQRDIERVLIAADGKLVGRSNALYERPDVTNVLSINSNERTGFSVNLDDLEVAVGGTVLLEVIIQLKSGLQCRTKTKRRVCVVA